MRPIPDGGHIEALDERAVSDVGEIIQQKKSARSKTRTAEHASKTRTAEGNKVLKVQGCSVRVK